MIRFKRISTTHEDYKEAADTLIKVLITRGYNTTQLRRTKRDIWLDYNANFDTQARRNNNPGEIIPVITYFDNFHWRLNKIWTRHIRDNKVFVDARIIAAFKKHKKLRDLLVKGRFGKHEEDTDPEALLFLLIELVERDNPDLIGN